MKRTKLFKNSFEPWAITTGFRFLTCHPSGYSVQEILGMIANHSSVSKSNWLHVDIFQSMVVINNGRYIPHILLK